MRQRAEPQFDVHINPQNDASTGPKKGQGACTTPVPPSTSSLNQASGMDFEPPFFQRTPARLISPGGRGSLLALRLFVFQAEQARRRNRLEQIERDGDMGCGVKGISSFHGRKFDGVQSSDTTRAKYSSEDCRADSHCT